MLRHISFNAESPEAVARIMSTFLDAEPIRAPAPPFPDGSWFVCKGDDRGSYLEILPLGYVFDAAIQVPRFDQDLPRSTGFHALLDTPLTVDEIRSQARAAGWQSDITATPLFTVVKLWVENILLIELLPAEFADTYRQTFGPTGVKQLEGIFRSLET